jgi:hypothetical protein
MVMPRRDPADFLPNIEDLTGRVCGALSAVVEESQLGSVETLVKAALDGMNTNFTNYRLYSLEQKLRRKSSKLQNEREKVRDLKARLQHRSPTAKKKKIPAGPLPLGYPEQ